MNNKSKKVINHKIPVILFIAFICLFSSNANLSAKDSDAFNTNIYDLSTLSPKLTFSMPYIENVFSNSLMRNALKQFSGWGDYNNFNNSYQMSLVELLQVAQSIIDQGFIEFNELIGKNIVFESADMGLVKVALQEQLSANPDKEHLEKILEIKTKKSEFGNYYYIGFTDEFLDKVKNSPNIIFDEWAWDKAADFVAHMNSVHLFLDEHSFSPLESEFEAMGIISEKDKRRVKNYLEFKEKQGNGQLGLYSVIRKKMAAVVLKKYAPGHRNADYKWISFSDYRQIPPGQKNALETEFQNAFSVKFLRNKKKYPLSDGKGMDQLLKGAKELNSFIGPNDQGVCLGRTPFYMFYAAMALEGNQTSIFNGKSERYVQVSFSGGDWIRSGKAHPNKAQIQAFRAYLTKLHLTPEEIIDKANNINNPGKTIIFDYLETGEGVESFLGILFDWAQELESTMYLRVSVKKLKDALLVYNLSAEKSFLDDDLENYFEPVVIETLHSSIAGVPLKYFHTIEYSDCLHLVNSNNSNFLDGIKASYPKTSWTEASIDPLSDKITYKGYLICTHILHEIEKQQRIDEALTRDIWGGIRSIELNPSSSNYFSRSI